MTQPRTRKLTFDVSSGLKNVLGAELITKDEVAIFELVKNSFDARATRVDLYFDTNKIVVTDNGTGMSYEDIKKKWLFVAYSSKRTPRSTDDFREIVEKRQYAGSKGIGRFSSDRLGGVINLQTRSKDDPGQVHSVTVNWSDFDHDYLDHFNDINVEYTRLDNFTLPLSLPKIKHGTAITIEQTRRDWDRQSILRLKSALSKLINPFGSTTDRFRIAVHAPKEQKADEADQRKARATKEDLPSNALVNGPVGNFIFSTLQEKTTFITVNLSADGSSFESTLIDRGEIIYRIREKNEYSHLARSGFRCQIYFLNTSAKLTFARRMGVPSVQFGSVFLFRNGFRVFPIGEPGDDWFKMDARKQQGQRRYLGSRDIIGRIDVSGPETAFQESSSRNDGLIETAAVRDLVDCFYEHCLKPLERYVVPVTFVDVEDRHSSDLSRLLTDPGRARVSAVVAKLVDNDNVELIEYSKRLIGLLNERSSQFESSLISLRGIAEKTGDKRLLKRIDEAAKRFEELREAEEKARKQADEEREAKEAAQARASTAEAAVSKVSEQLSEEKKRNLFLTSISTLDTDTILNLHHQVTQYAVAVQQHIENFLVKISGKTTIPAADVMNAFDRISLLNRKIMGVSKFATKANFRLESEKIEADLAEYVEQYINDVAREFVLGPMAITVSSDEKGFVQSFKPIDVAVVVDNLIANAKKAKASQIAFSISHPSKNTVHITATDDGRGVDPKISDLEQIFEKGFSTTDGSGLGLYHVRLVLGEMKGTIEASRNEGAKGTNFLIRIAK